MAAEKIICDGELFTLVTTYRVNLDIEGDERFWKSLPVYESDESGELFGFHERENQLYNWKESGDESPLIPI
jgi:hypothetical protein